MEHYENEKRSGFLLEPSDLPRGRSGGFFLNRKNKIKKDKHNIIDKNSV